MDRQGSREEFDHRDASVRRLGNMRFRNFWTSLTTSSITTQNPPSRLMFVTPAAMSPKSKVFRTCASCSGGCIHTSKNKIIFWRQLHSTLILKVICTEIFKRKSNSREKVDREINIHRLFRMFRNQK